MNNTKRDKFVALVYISHQMDYLREYLNTGNPKQRANAVHHSLWLLCDDIEDDMVDKFATLDFQKEPEKTLYTLMDIKNKIMQRVKEDPPSLEDLEGGDKLIKFFIEDFKT